MFKLIIQSIGFILNLKFGWLLLIVLGLLGAGSLIKNIMTGSFSVGKLASGFNVFNGSVQGKLIYYGLIIFACFVVYSFIMRTTYSYDTDYKNQIQHNQDVMIDQRAGTIEGCNVNLFYGLIKLGCKSQPITKTVNINPEYEKYNQTKDTK